MSRCLAVNTTQDLWGSRCHALPATSQLTLPPFQPHYLTSFLPPSFTSSFLPHSPTSFSLLPSSSPFQTSSLSLVSTPSFRESLHLPFPSSSALSILPHHHHLYHSLSPPFPPSPSFSEWKPREWWARIELHPLPVDGCNPRRM